MLIFLSQCDMFLCSMHELLIAAFQYHLMQECQTILHYWNHPTIQASNFYAAVIYFKKLCCNSQFSVWAYFEAFYLKIPEARCTLLYETIFGNWKFFKNDEKCFLFHLKSSFCSWKICSQIFALNTLKLSCRPFAFT